MVPVIKRSGFPFLSKSDTPHFLLSGKSLAVLSGYRKLSNAGKLFLRKAIASVSDFICSMVCPKEKFVKEINMIK
jgi:hypothetical protein